MSKVGLSTRMAEAVDDGGYSSSSSSAHSQLVKETMGIARK
nr:hypothetical protein [uncultured Porphyromonas sp.]